MSRRLLALAAVATALTLCVPSATASPRDDKPVTFRELVRGHIKARINAKQLPPVDRGLRFDPTPAVYVTVTPSELLVYGKVVHPLANGRVKRNAVAKCRSGVVCLPALRERIAQERAHLGKALRIVPRILLLLDVRVPYATMLLALRSAADAGAHLSIRIVGRASDDRLLELPVLVAPSRTHELDSAAPPGLVTATMTGDNAIVSSNPWYQPQGPAHATGRDAILQELGVLQLASGRPVFFLAASSATTAGSVVDVIARSRQQFRHVVLMAPGDRPIQLKRP